MALHSSTSTSQNPFMLKPTGVSAEEQQKRLAKLNVLLHQNKLSTSQRNGFYRGLSLYGECLRVLDVEAPEGQHPLLPFSENRSASSYRVSNEDKQKNPLLHIPPALLGYLSIPAAYALVHLPAALNRLVVGEMTEADKAFAQKLIIKDLETSRYSPKEYAEKVQHAEALLTRFKNEGDRWFEALPAVQYFLTKHCNPETNREVAVARLKQQVMMEALCLKYGLETHRLQDMDGTQVFKNFATATCGVEPNISPKDRVAHYATIAFNAKAREALNYSDRHKDETNFTMKALIQDLLDLGFYKPTETGLSRQQLEAYLAVWADNADKAFPHLTQQQLKYMLLSAIESANTARAGATINEISEAIPPNEALGLGVGVKGSPHRFNVQGQHDFFSMLGHDRRPDLPTQYMFDINGYSGTVLRNEQMYHPLETIELGYSGIFDIPALKELIDDLSQGAILPRVVEFKGNYTLYDKELVTDYLNYRAEKLAKSSNPEDQRAWEWIQAQPGFDQVKWNAKDPIERAKWMNLVDLRMPNKEGKAIGKPAFAMPFSWVAEKDRLLIDALTMLNDLDADKRHPNHGQFSKVLDVIARRTRALSTEDYEFFDLPRLEAVQTNGKAEGQTMLAQARREAIEKYTKQSLAKRPDDLPPEGIVPMGKKFLAEITRLQQKPNLKKEDIEALLKEINTVDFGCVTVHTITAHLQGVYDTWERVAEQQKSVPHGFKKDDPRTAVLESGKADMYNRFLAAAENPDVQEALKNFEMIMMKIKSSAPELEYELGNQKQALFNMMNNSSGDHTYETFEKLTQTLAEKYGFTFLRDPTGSYTESTLGQGIDKQGAVNNILNFSRRIHMAGDSTGSDMGTIIDLALLRPFNSSEVVRGMIDDVKLFNKMIQVLNFDEDSTKKINAEAKILRQHGFDEAFIKKAKALVKQQCLAQPLRYHVVGQNKKGELENLKALRNQRIDAEVKRRNLDAKAEGFEAKLKAITQQVHEQTPKAGLQLIGHGHEDVLKAFGYEPNKLFTEQEYRELAKKVFTDAIKPNILYADDVGHKHMRDALAKGIAFDEINPLLRFLKNSHLADAFLDLIPGFENREAFSMGMPFHMGYTLDKFRPKAHEILGRSGKALQRNVYHPVHRMLLNLPAFAMKSAEAGGLLAALGGAVGVGVTYFQLKEHARSQKDATTAPPIHKATSPLTKDAFQPAEKLRDKNGASSTAPQAQNISTQKELAHA